MSFILINKYQAFVLNAIKGGLSIAARGQRVKRIKANEHGGMAGGSFIRGHGLFASTYNERRIREEAQLLSDPGNKCLTSIALVPYQLRTPPREFLLQHHSEELHRGAGGWLDSLDLNGLDLGSVIISMRRGIGAFSRYVKA